MQESSEIEVHPKKVKKPETGRLSVKTIPDNTKIRILNIKPEFEQDIALKPGKYHIEISAKGYETIRRWINLKAGKRNEFEFHLKKKPVKTIPDNTRTQKQHATIVKSETGRIFVKTIPYNARIQFLDIEQEFYQGMELKPGKYLIDVSKEGYNSRTIWILIKNGENEPVEIKLSKIHTFNTVPKKQYDHKAAMRRAEKANPHYSMALDYIERGEYHKAKHELRIILSHNPTNELARRKLEEIERY